MSARPRRYSQKKRPVSEPVTVTIDHIGARGDGVAQGPSGPLFIPGTAPGDQVVAIPGEKRGDGWAAKMKDLLVSGPDRVEPVCQHAAACGGCSLQHMDLAAIARIKRGHLVEALGRRGIDADLVGQTREVPPGTRRRLRLTIVRPGGRAQIGFNAQGTSRLIDIQECPVARPEIVALLPALRDLATSMNSLGKGGDVQVTLSDTGFDLMFIPARPSDPDLAERQRLVAFAEKYDIARIAWESDGFAEPVAARRPARLMIAGVPVDLPIGAFLQPSREGEAILVDLVRAGLPQEAKIIADLYAGCGSLSLPLAVAGANVFAAEGEAAPVEALRRAAAGLRVQAECRDLAKHPLSESELARYDAVIFDPPRAGAAAQAERLAWSNVKTIVAVSCNPATLARDLSTLIEGGYEVQHVTPVDQFTWSSHLEAVAVLTR
ncbi:MAG: class I SAM-dependent RNA methyltransferase [Alphaproteobacteria bacterium]|nr:class I SAM-dependent RNA methyltransferase [Alphaproteobacteria bacterium]